MFLMNGETRQKQPWEYSGSMENKFVLTINGKNYEYETIHVIDDDVRKTFQDLIDPFNKITWTDGDVEWFLKTKGVLISHKFTGSNISSDLKNKEIDGIEKIIICLYTSSIFSITEYENIIKTIINNLPLKEEAAIMTGWIVDESIHPEIFNVNLIAICASDLL